MLLDDLNDLFLRRPEERKSGRAEERPHTIFGGQESADVDEPERPLAVCVTRLRGGEEPGCAEGREGEEGQRHNQRVARGDRSKRHARE